MHNAVTYVFFFRYLNPVVAEKQFSEVSQPTALKEYRQATPAEYASWIIDGYAVTCCHFGE